MDTPSDGAPARSVPSWTLAGSMDLARSELTRDRLATGLALAMAIVTLALVARGLTLSQSGGILRLAPYAVLVLGPAVAALAVLRPWPGLVAWVVVMPALNIARVSVAIGPVQVLLPTAIIAALLIGLALELRREARAPSTRLERWTYVATVALVALAAASLLAGAAPAARAIPIALHGLVEPAVLLAVVVALRPSWRGLVALVIAMGASVALASVFNLVRIVVVRHQLATIDQMRIQLARLTYFNVGIYGDMIAMTVPLIVGALLIRRALSRPRWSSGLIALGLAVTLAGLYLTLSKSGWLGAAVAGTALVFFLSTTWKHRVAVVVVGAVLAAAVVPWPAYVLRPLAPALAGAYEDIAATVNHRATSIDPSTPEGEVSVTERLLATEAALRMSIDHPLLGVGPGGFAAAYHDRYRPASSTRSLDSAHDLLPYIAAEFGLPAAVLVGIALLSAIVLGWLAGVRSGGGYDPPRVIPFAVAAALIGFVLVSATFGVDLYRDYRFVNSDVLFAGLLVALGLVSWRLSREEPAEVAAGG